MRYRIEIRPEGIGQSRWYIVAPGGKPIAIGSSVYSDPEETLRAAQRAIAVIRACVIEGIDQ